MHNSSNKEKKAIKCKIKQVQKQALCNGLNVAVLEEYDIISNDSKKFSNQLSKKILILLAVSIFVISVISANAINSLLSARCLLPSNYFVWEATRPLADCNYCINVTRPIILRNISTGKDFEEYAYLPKPIIVKNAVDHWKAKVFDFDMFKRLYEETEGSYDSFDDGCQFLNFKTDLFSLKDVFNMPEDRKRFDPGQKPWYVGWGNCHPDILYKLRQYYSIPDFLPEDSEFPATENIFIGYDMGAVMHLDYIPRLMWQGQVKGNKTWKLAPVPECDHVCNIFEFYVEPGDVVLLDTRIWYHATSIAKGQFSLTVQSEYG